MSKYIQLSVAQQMATGTTTSDGIATDQLIDAAATFLDDGIRPGDIVFNGTSNAIAGAVASLDLPAPPGVTTQLNMVAGHGVDTAQDYIIYSQDATTTYQLVPLDAIASVAQASATSTVIQVTAVANATYTITHTDYGTLADPLFANLILDAMVEASSPNDRPKVVTDIDTGILAFIDSIVVS